MTVPSSFIGLANLARLPEPFLWLLEVHSPSGGGLLGPDGQRYIPRLTTYSQPVAWNKQADGTDQIWTPYQFEIEEIQASAEGDLEGMTIVLGNAFYQLAQYWELNDRLRDHAVILRLVNLATLADPNAHHSFRFIVAQSELTESVLALRVASGAAAEQDIPLSVVTNTCRFAYRGEGCFFVGDPGDVELGLCSFTRSACRKRGEWEAANGYAVIHPRQFGGTASEGDSG